MSAIGPGSLGVPYSAGSSPAFGQGQSSTTNFSGQTQDQSDTFTPSSQKKSQQQAQS